MNIIPILITLIISSNLIAKDSIFIGASISKNSFSFSNSILGSAPTSEMVQYGRISNDYIKYDINDYLKDTTVNIKFGFINNFYRQYLQYGKLFNKEYMTYNSLTYNFDKIFTLYTLGLDTFIGAHIGIGKIDNTLANKLTDYGTEFGMQCGVLKDINKYVQIETSVRYTQSKVNIHNITSYELRNKLNNYKSFYIGLNYKL